MKYKALGHISHDNTHYYPGDEIELSSDDAKPLLEIKAIEPYIKPFSKGSTNDEKRRAGNV